MSQATPTLGSSWKPSSFCRAILPAPCRCSPSFWDPSSVAKPGYLDASQYHGLIPVSTFPEAAQEIQRRFEAGDSAVVADSVWLSECEANGVCPKFSMGDGQATFRIPYMPVLYPGAPLQGQKPGDYLGDAIRNITGKIVPRSANNSGFVLRSDTSESDGALRTFNVANATSAGSGTVSVPVGGIEFDASLAEGVITAEVNRPATAVMTPFIKMYGTVTEEGAANMAALIELTTQLIDRVRVETWQAEDGSGWYRDYSDGWIEQGGYISTNRRYKYSSKLL